MRGERGPGNEAASLQYHVEACFPLFSSLRRETLPSSSSIASCRLCACVTCRIFARGDSCYLTEKRARDVRHFGTFRNTTTAEPEEDVVSCPDAPPTGEKECLVTLLDFLGPNTFRARSLSSPIRLQHCPSLIKLRVLPLRGMLENFRELLRLT